MKRGWLAAAVVALAGAASLPGLGLRGKTVEQVASPERVAAGATLFHERGCVFCHGEDLQGTDKAPYLNSIGRQWTRKQIEKQIREGGGGMPAFGGILTDDDVATLVDFLSSRRKPVPKDWKPWNATGAAKAPEN